MRIDPSARRHAHNATMALEHTPRTTNVGHPALAATHTLEAATDSAAAETPGAWAAADVEAFRIFAEANRRTESGGAATFSTLRTTAGSLHRASFGVAQLSIREHVARLSRQSEGALSRLGTSRDEVAAIRRRGEATVAFYHLIVDRRGVEGSAATLAMEPSTADALRTLASDSDAAGVRRLVGERFEATTGLPAAALDELVATRALRDPNMRAAFAEQYVHDHGSAFDPMQRDAPRMSITARHVLSAHPELEPAATALGGDDAAFTSLAHYLGVGDSAENLLGWHARAASSAVGAARLRALLASVDTTTSHARELEDFERALAAVARIDDLVGDARVATLARIGRIFHGSPTHAREALFVDGRLDTPRCGTRTELDALLDEMRAGRRWSDARLAERVAEVVAERRTS